MRPMRLSIGLRAVNRTAAFLIAFSLCLILSPYTSSLSLQTAQAQSEKQEFLKQEEESIKARKERVKSLMKEAKSRMKKKEYGEAIPLLVEVLELDPTHSKAERELKEARKRAEESGQTGPLFTLATEEERSVFLDKAERKKHKQMAREAKSLYKDKQYEEALTILDGILERDPGHRYAKPLRPKTVKALEKARTKLEDAVSQVLEEAESPAEKANDAEVLPSAVAEALDSEDKVRTDFKQGKKYMDQGKYEKAIEVFRSAWQTDPNHELIPKIFEYIEQAETQLASAPPPLDEPVVQAQLEPVIKQQAANPIRSNRADARGEISMTGSPRYDSEVDKLLKTARDDLDAGRVQDAIAGYRRVLRKESQNAEARSGLKRAYIEEAALEQGKLDFQKALDEQEMLLEVDEKVLLPGKDEVPGPSSGRRVKRGPRPFAKEHYRDRLKAPVTLDFKGVSLVSVLDFLAESTGVNIVPDQDVQESNYKVTTFVKDLPLEEALKYMLKTHSLTYRVEDEAVWVTTHEALKGEKMQTKFYTFRHGAALFERLEASIGGQIGSAGGYGGLGGAPQVAEVVTLKEIVEQSVPFPQGASLVYDERTGSIIVTNTPTNQRIIEKLIYELDVPPVQVLIEARFIEVDVTDLDEFVGDLNLTSALKIRKQGAQGGRGTLEIESGSGFNVGTSTILTGKGASGTSTSLASASEGFNLSLSGVLSRPQFSATINALKEMDRSKTLSSPRITTLNHQTATIEVTDEFIYPTRYEVQLIQFDINGDGDFEDAEETQFANVPQEFATRDVGVILRVTPDIGLDKGIVSLAIIPEVTTANDPGTSSGGFSFAGNVDLPKFTTSNVSTSVMMASGDTVVLGGLIEEIHENTETKVPVVSDIPLVGKLFRKERESIRRRNLLIFVTATILEPPGSVELAALDAE